MKKILWQFFFILGSFSLLVFCGHRTSLGTREKGKLPPIPFQSAAGEEEKK